MTDRFTPVVRALVVATLLLATAIVMLVTVNAAPAANALAIGVCGADGKGYDFVQRREGAQQRGTCGVVRVPSPAARLHLAARFARVGGGKAAR